MEKKVTEKEIREMAKEIFRKDKEEREKKYNLAQSNMRMAEDALINTFDNKQRELYKKYCEERDAFIKIEKEKYVKLF